MRKVTAVIVTYNSNEYIGRLLDNLLSQSYPLYQIIIVDNNSSDDTCDIINGYHNKQVYLHQLDDNLGGAGGFAYGFMLAQNSDCDDIVSFDDDAYPEDENFILEMTLVKEKYKKDVLSPLVVDSNNHALGAYEYKVNNKRLVYIHEIQQVYLIDNEIKLFNGVLFNKKVIAEIGVPRAEFFIRGDEQEYKSRILKAGYKTAVFTQAVVYHPSSVHEYFYINKKRYHHLDSPFKLFYSVRNQAYLLRLREDIGIIKKSKLATRQISKYTYFYLWHKKDPKNYFLWLKAYSLGLAGYVVNNRC